MYMYNLDIHQLAAFGQMRMHHQIDIDAALVVRILWMQLGRFHVGRESAIHGVGAQSMLDHVVHRGAFGHIAVNVNVGRVLVGGVPVVEQRLVAICMALLN